MSNESEFSHLDSRGHVRMVNVGGKTVSAREARAVSTVIFPPGVLKRVLDGDSPKGDVAAAARIAGMSAAKKTSELIPLCHAIGLTSVAIDFRVCEPDSIEVTCAACAEAKTGVEMEALVGASIAALTIYDMCKALSKGIRITEVALLYKSGGRSGEWRAQLANS
ncbi:MAG: cyclic pyranopterin monophosphate synthase MoaC [Planctomycetes bacterium]|nr:cyclic pyranopterin monophosphate synthase MoaC [Planctomycetota bacterium]